MILNLISFAHLEANDINVEENYARLNLKFLNKQSMFLKLNSYNDVYSYIKRKMYI